MKQQVEFHKTHRESNKVLRTEIRFGFPKGLNRHTISENKDAEYLTDQTMILYS